MHREYPTGGMRGGRALCLCFHEADHGRGLAALDRAAAHGAGGGEQVLVVARSPAVEARWLAAIGLDDLGGVVGQEPFSVPTRQEVTVGAFHQARGARPVDLLAVHVAGALHDVMLRLLKVAQRLGVRRR